MRLLVAAVLLTACAPKPAPPSDTSSEASTPMPPTTRRSDHVDQYFQVEVADPYTWLEDLDSDETVAWVKTQNAASRAVLDAAPERAPFKARLTELWDFEQWSAPRFEGGRYFWTYNDGKMDQPQLLVADALDAKPRVLLDANTLSEDGTVTVGGWSVSKDGRYLAWAIADAGSDWRTWKVRDIATGEDLDDTLSWVKFSGASWLPDSSGFLYSRYPAPRSEAFEERLSQQSVYFHRVGTPQTDDILVYEDTEHPEWGFHASATDDGTRIFLHVSQGTADKSRQYFLATSDLDLTTPGGKAGGTLVKLLDDFDADYQLLGTQGDTAWFHTDLDAERGRVIAIDLQRPARSSWREVIPQTDDTLRSVARMNGHLVASYLSKASSRVVVYTMDGKRLHEVALPGIGSLADWSGDHDETEAFLSFSSFTTPTSVYRLHIPQGTTTPLWSPKVPFNPDDFVTEQVWYPSKDGTSVPMFLTYRKDLDRSAPHPTLLYGYGGFNIPITPGFKVQNLAWVEQGGIYASANLRGGGEFGRQWHDDGTQLHKQNVFDDFIAAAEWLIDEGRTTAGQLGIHGRSNGGLLVGATLVQRPELFGAAIPSVGVLDMLKYHQWTIGWAWAPDYGTSADSKAMFDALLAYSPVHNARPGVTYPATLITTGDHDDRVVPGHSYKFAAALQHAHVGDPPVIIRIETRAGHGAGTPVSMLVEEEADKLGFLAHHLGLTVTATP